MEIPKDTREQIEKIILKILYNENAVKSTNLLIEKVLAITFEEKITISEKNIKHLINRMDKEKKIQFSQAKGGWKIQI
ncbi:MAG: hypothetical protein EU532_13970 [Promethearchaeota archaeon]|nr:MAG: hypothetical protein EU532_13970 [Candidatus Lokiarchaeota archaeon]